MRKLYLSIIGFSLLCRLNGHAQTTVDGTPIKPVSLYTPIAQDSSDYSSRKLKIDEINFVSSYYTQNGNHSAVTGGIGTEQVLDLANGLDLKLLWNGPNGKKNTLSAGLGFDYHSSASSAYVNKSGASSKDGTRIYPSIDWTVEGKKGGTFGIGAYYSGEYNYSSLGADLHFSVKTPNKNGEFSAKLQGYFDQVTLIYPSELIPASTTTTTTTVVTSASGRTSTSGGSSSPSIPTSPRNTFSGSLSYSQMINSRLQVALLVDGVTQSGYLGLPFHRVYFANTSTAVVENLPSTRYKLPIGARLNYFIGDNLILRTYYRYYTDDWGTKSNTANLEIAYKITPFFSVSPFYRYYDQTAAKYFAPYGVHTSADQYYTSNYAYAQFNSSFFGAGMRIAPPKGVLGWQHLHELEIRYGHYTQTTGLMSDVVSLAFGFK
jgi:hypothetical protein